MITRSQTFLPRSASDSYLDHRASSIHRVLTHQTTQSATNVLSIRWYPRFPCRRHGNMHPPPLRHIRPPHSTATFDRHIRPPHSTPSAQCLALLRLAKDGL